MTPDNAGYYHAAYVVSACLYVAYVASLRWRLREIRRRRDVSASGG